MKNVRYEPVITLGTMITLITMMMSVGSFVMYNEHRLGLHEAMLAMHEYKIHQLQLSIAIHEGISFESLVKASN